jgi:hypothetical protein
MPPSSGIDLMMGAVNTSETSDNFYKTKHSKIVECSHLHIRCRENLKSHTEAQGTPD